MPLYTGTRSTLLGSRNWASAYSQALNLDSTGWSGFNMRQLIAASLLTKSGSAVRMTMTAATGTSGLSISGMHIGHAASSGDAYDFDGGQVPVAVSGALAFTIAQGVTVVTDAIPFAFNLANNFIIAVHFDATSSLRGANSITNVTNYFKSAANETGTANVTGYSTTASALRLVTLIEVLQ